MSEAVRKEIESHTRELLTERLSHCTEKQQAFFHRIWPNGIESIPNDDLIGAIDLCDRTIASNGPKP